MAGALCGRRQMRAARPLLGEKPASGAVRVEVDGDNDSLKTYFMPAGGATSAMGHFRPWSAIDADGSLSLDSFRPGRMPATAELGHFRTLALQQENRGLYPCDEVAAALPTHPAFRNLCGQQLGARVRC